MVLLLQGVKVGRGVAALHGAGFTDGPGLGQQGLNQGGFAAAGVTDQRDVADVLSLILGHSCSFPGKA